MKPTVTLLIGNPLSGEEARFLRTLYEDLLCADALILANFHVADRQIDFLVVTVGRAAILELKHLWTPVFGRENGPWSYLDAAGKRVRYCGAKNPYQQTLDQKYALSDRMKAYQSRRPDVPPAAGPAFYTDFDAFVCIWPQLHPQSQVTRGDRKVSVRSYGEVMEGLRRGGSRAGWSIGDWRAFAEMDLNLTAVTLAQATDARIADATEKTQAYRAKLVASIGSVLPPLIDTVDEEYGSNLVEKAKEPFNLVLVGASGSAKTFHLHHLAVALAQSGDEIPLLVQARKHRGGDFVSLLRQGVSPFFAGEPKDLLEAIRLSGLRPVLLVDALNECEERFQLELLRGVQAFLLRSGARVVITSQSEPVLPGDLQATKCDLLLPDLSKKKAIYCHHAGIGSTADVEEFCKGFTNAYDLTLAGRCHQAGLPAASPLDVYDRYVRRALSKHTSVNTALLRQVANEMRLTTSTIWTRDRFERTCEQFLHAEQASLEALDEIRASRLVDLTDDFFSFEHELLLHYFQAEALRREVPLVADLAAELRKPRHQPLLGLILPRFSGSADIKALLAAVDDRSVFDRAFNGLCGAAVQTVLSQECMALLRSAVDDLPNITVDCTTSKAEDGRRLFTGLAVAGNRSWTAHEASLCHLIARQLDQPAFRDAFLELLDLTEWSLRVAVDAGAARARFKATGVWGEAVRVFAVLPQMSPATGMELPCLEVLSGLHRVVEAGRGDVPPAVEIRRRLE